MFLIRASGFETHSIPYGLLYISYYLLKNGIESKILDREGNTSIERLKKSLFEHNPDIIGISAMTFQAQDAKEIIEKIRDWMPDKIIVVGGVHFTALPEEGLEYGADYVIRGEGEICLTKLILNGFNSQNRIIQGLQLKNLDEISQIKMEDLKTFIKNPEVYKGKGLQIITARGCPYNCNFCLGRDQRPKGLRYISIDNVIDYISKLNQHYNIDSFNIVDDIFVLKSSRVSEFCEKIKKIGKPLRFHCFTHAGHGNLELYKKMKKAGFHRISMGVEHGNDEILKIMGKNTTKAKIEETCKQIRKAKIVPNLTYVLGNIKETNKTITETVDFAIYLHKKYKAASWFSYMQPLPGSPVYKVAEKYGRYLEKKFTYQNVDLCYLPFGVTLNHIKRERERGMREANSLPFIKNIIFKIKKTISTILK